MQLIHMHAQELLPSRDAEDGDAGGRAGGGQLKTWLAALGKKPAKPEDPEALKVPPHEPGSCAGQTSYARMAFPGTAQGLLPVGAHAVMSAGWGTCTLPCTWGHLCRLVKLSAACDCSVANLINSLRADCTYLVPQAKQREKEQQKKERLLLGKPHGGSSSGRRDAAAAAAQPPAAAGAEEAAEQARRSDRFLAAHFRPPGGSLKQQGHPGRPASARPARCLNRLSAFRCRPASDDPGCGARNLRACAAMWSLEPRT